MLPANVATVSAPSLLRSLESGVRVDVSLGICVLRLLYRFDYFVKKSVDFSIRLVYEYVGNTANALTDEPMIPWRTCMTAFFTSCNAVVVLDSSVGEEFL